MTSLNRWRLSFFVLLLLSLPVIAFLAYIVIDQAITNDYRSVSYQESVTDLNRLAQLFPRNTYKKKDIITLLRRNNKAELIVETECTIYIGGLRFEFGEKEQLINIEPQAEYSPENDCKNT